jgi:ribosomal protein S1
MSEAKEQIDKILTEERVPEFEFGAVYSGTIVEIVDRGVFVQLHSEMQPALIPNSQLDAKKVSGSVRRLPCRSYSC